MTQLVSVGVIRRLIYDVGKSHAPQRVWVFLSR